LILRSKILAEYVPEGEKEAKRTLNFEDCHASQGPVLPIAMLASFFEEREASTRRTPGQRTRFPWQSSPQSLKFFAKLSFKKAEKGEMR
jgi:hypothetical protein